MSARAWPLRCAQGDSVSCRPFALSSYNLPPSSPSSPAAARDVARPGRLTATRSAKNRRRRGQAGVEVKILALMLVAERRRRARHSVPTMVSSSRTLSPCRKTPTSPPKQIVTPAASAARKLYAWPRGRASACRVLDPAVEVGGVRLAGGKRGTQCHAALVHEAEHLRRTVVAVLTVSTPARTARRMPSGDMARPPPTVRAAAAATNTSSSCCENVGLSSPRAPGIVRVHLDRLRDPPGCERRG
jgi:hypothetical protein